MDLSAALAADLTALSEALHGDVDLETTLRHFAATAALAVPSYLGMTMTVIVDGHRVSFTEPERPGGQRPVATSVMIPLSDIAGSEAGSSLVLYAAAPGAFVDLAADLTYALQVGPDVLALDAQRTPAVDESGLNGLADLTQINQALGILIGVGHTLDGARSELQRLAHRAQSTLRVAAQELIHASTPGPKFDQA
jgi:hypothetical protein